MEMWWDENAVAGLQWRLLPRRAALLLHLPRQPCLMALHAEAAVLSSHDSCCAGSFVQMLAVVLSSCAAAASAAHC